MSAARSRPGGAFATLFFLFLSGWAAAAVGPVDSEVLAKARALLDSGRAREALPLVDSAIARDPSSAEAYLLRGQIRIELKDWPGSEADLQKGLDLAPMLADAHYLRGYRYAMDGKNKLAIQFYDRAIELAPERADFWYARGTAKERRNNFTGAREDYQQALLRAPDDIAARRELSLVEERLGLTPAASRSIPGIEPLLPEEMPTSIPGIEPLPDAMSGAAGGTAETSGLSAAGLAADALPPEEPASATAASSPVADSEPPPGIRTDEATGAAATELLLTFARAVLYLGAMAEPAGDLHAVCEGLAGDYFALELSRDAQSGEVEVGPATALALGNDRAYALTVAQRYAASDGGPR